MRTYMYDVKVSRKNIDLRKEVEMLNNELFNGKIITDFEIKWTKASRFTGKVSCSITRGEVKKLSISDKFELTYGHFLSTLAHELIHCYCVQNKIDCGRDCHSKGFNVEAERINAIIDFDEIECFDYHNLKYKEAKKVVIVHLIDKKDNDDSICVFDSSKEDYLYTSLMSISHSSYFIDKEIRLLILETQNIGNYPIKRKMDGKFYHITDELRKDLYNAEVIEVITRKTKIIKVTI